jgi:hypothetical protein
MNGVRRRKEVAAVSFSDIRYAISQLLRFRPLEFTCYPKKFKRNLMIRCTPKIFESGQAGIRDPTPFFQSELSSAIIYCSYFKYVGINLGQ